MECEEGLCWINGSLGSGSSAGRIDKMREGTAQTYQSGSLSQVIATGIYCFGQAERVDTRRNRMRMAGLLTPLFWIFGFRTVPDSVRWLGPTLSGGSDPPLAAGSPGAQNTPTFTRPATLPCGELGFWQGPQGLRVNSSQTFRSIKGRTLPPHHHTTTLPLRDHTATLLQTRIYTPIHVCAILLLSTTPQFKYQTPAQPTVLM